MWDRESNLPYSTLAPGAMDKNVVFNVENLMFLNRKAVNYSHLFFPAVWNAG
jgi:hypothetical protein